MQCAMSRTLDRRKIQLTVCVYGVVWILGVTNGLYGSATKAIFTACCLIIVMSTSVCVFMAVKCQFLKMSGIHMFIHIILITPTAFIFMHFS